MFYGVADAYKPASGLPMACTAAPPCLAVNPFGSDKRVVVAVAGKRLQMVAGGQPRASAADKQDAANYLEGENGNNPPLANIYEQSPISDSFNDFVLYQ